MYEVFLPHANQAVSLPLVVNLYIYIAGLRQSPGMNVLGALEKSILEFFC